MGSCKNEAMINGHKVAACVVCETDTECTVLTSVSGLSLSLFTIKTLNELF